jgi:hypothetical protein
MSEKRSLILNPQRRYQAEQARNDWVVNAEAGTTINDVLNPAYWAHVAQDFTDYDHVEVRLETGEWVLELTVIEHDRSWAKMFVRHRYDLEEVEPMPAPEARHIVDYKGPQLKHCVIRISDREVIQSGISTKVEAQRWMVDYEQRTAVPA